MLAYRGAGGRDGDRAGGGGIAADWSAGVDHGAAWGLKLMALKYHVTESAKRVAAAVGEGSMAVMLVHRYLAEA